MLAAEQGRRSASWIPVVTCEIAAATLFTAEKAGGLHGTMLLVTPLSVAILGCFIAVDRWANQYKLRSSADAWIARGYDSARSRYGWRIEELTCRRERKLLAASLHRIVDELENEALVSAAPLDRVALRPCKPVFEAIVVRLEDMTRPVSASGVLAVERLITDGAASPLYKPSRDAGPRLAEILDLLEVRR
jgi:hypothetical protein